MKYLVYRGKTLIGEAVKMSGGYQILEFKNLRSPTYFITESEFKKKRLKLVSDASEN